MPNTKKSLCIKLLQDSVEKAENLIDECENKEPKKTNTKFNESIAIVEFLLQQYANSDSSLILYLNEPLYLQSLLKSEFSTVITEIYNNHQNEIKYYCDSKKYIIQNPKLTIIAAENAIKAIENLQDKSNLLQLKFLMCCPKPSSKNSIIKSSNEEFDFDLIKCFFVLKTLQKSNNIYDEINKLINLNFIQSKNH